MTPNSAPADVTSVSESARHFDATSATRGARGAHAPRPRAGAVSQGTAHTGMHAAATHATLHVSGQTAHAAPRAPRHRALATPHLAASAVSTAPLHLETTIALDHPIRAVGWRAVVKRSVDVVGALAGLLLAAPVLVLAAACIKLDSTGPVFFAHDRIGRRGRTFRCYKLRTMCLDAEQRLAADPQLDAAYRTHDYKLPAHLDTRITRLGAFLRTSSLDEVPQFWNVLRGDMSLVGPRPVVREELAHFGPERPLLLSVKPGITGAWATSGRSKVGYPQRAQLELDYVRRWSIRRDLAILLRTIVVVAQRRGAY